VTSGTVRSASATVVGQVGDLAGGLHDVAVPAHGSMTLEVVADAS
jgi:hypothetical protein